MLPYCTEFKYCVLLHLLETLLLFWCVSRRERSSSDLSSLTSRLALAHTSGAPTQTLFVPVSFTLALCGGHANSASVAPQSYLLVFFLFFFKLKAITAYQPCAHF